MSNPATPTPQMHRITPDCQPVFPCWAYASRCKPPQWLLIMDGYDTVEELLAVGYTHYCSVKPPTAPTSRPDETIYGTPVKSAVTTGATQDAALLSDPRKEEAKVSAVPPFATPAQSAPKITTEHDGLAKEARQLETELAASKAECERLKEQRDSLHALHNRNAKYSAELLDTCVQLRAENATLTTELSGLVHENAKLRAQISTKNTENPT